VKPFALSSGAEFRSFMLLFGPAQYPHGAYQKQAIELIRLSAELDDNAKVIAEYWADGSGSVTPPGHWNVFAQHVSQRDAHTLDDDVKMFFILGNTLMDAAIAVWDCKRAADSIRPVSAIRFLFRYDKIRAWAGPGARTRVIDGDQFQMLRTKLGFRDDMAESTLKRMTSSDAQQDGSLRTLFGRGRTAT
jgi:hypothetical protein